MTKALTQKAVDALNDKRPAAKREIADGGQPGLYLVAGPRVMRWMIRYRAPGSRANVKHTIGDYGHEEGKLGLADARKKAEAALRTVREGRDPRTDDDAVKWRSATVEQAFDEFIDGWSRKRNKARTVDSNKAFIDREIIKAWKGRRIQSITRRDVIALIDAIAETRPQSAVRVRALLSKAFSWFAEKAIVRVDANPFVAIGVPAPSRSRDRVLADREIRWLWKASEASGWPFGHLVRLLLLTGQRRDEVAAAMWSEFKFEMETATWTIPGERTKNRRAQVLPLPSQARAIVMALPRIADLSTGQDSKYILTTEGTAPISGYSRAKARLDAEMLAIARKEVEGRGGDPAEVNIPEWRFHDLRRTAASGMAALGFPVHVVEAVLNHKSGAISGVAAIYNRHDYLPEKGAALAAWAAQVDTIVGEAPATTNVVQLQRRQEQ